MDKTINLIFKCNCGYENITASFQSYNIINTRIIKLSHKDNSIAGYDCIYFKCEKCNKEISLFLKESLEPAQIVKPSDIIKKYMKEKGWNKRGLLKAINQCKITKRYGIKYKIDRVDSYLKDNLFTCNDIELLSNIFNQSKEFWRNLEKNYRERIK